MRILKVIFCLMTVRVSVEAAKKNNGEGNINCENAAVNQTAHVGGSVSVNCKYPPAEKSNIGYFCRKDGNLGCTHLISANTSVLTQQDRLSLTDNGKQSAFTVVMSSLAQEDSGTYRCAMKRVHDNSTACLTEIHLHVLDWDDIIPVEADVTTDTAKITCRYSESNEQSEKSLCKGNTPSDCEQLIRTTNQDKYVVNGRFTIRDNRRKKYFYGYIKKMTRADSGTYWCGAGGEYTKIQLSVAEKHLKKEGDTAGPDDPPPDDPPPADPPAELIPGIVVPLVLLLIAAILLIVFRRKICRREACCAAGDSSEQRTNAGHITEGQNNADHQYEEIHLQQQQQAAAPLSVYATVNPPADLVHYASVNFHNNENSVPDTNKNGSPAFISRPEGSVQPPESTLYSTVSPTQAK